MKKILFLLMQITVAIRLNAQTPKTKPNTTKPPVKVDTAKKQDNMPVVKPADNSTMPVVAPPDNSRMPVIDPDQKDKTIDRRKQPRKQ